MRLRSYRTGRPVPGPALLATLLLASAVPLGAQVRYIAFGDSVTEADGFDEPDRECPEECGYPPRLEELLRADGEEAEVVNAGRSGEATAEGLSRLDEVLAEEGGDVLLLMEGTNDISRGISPETIRFNLDEMARRAAAQGLITVHATLIPRLPGATVDPDNAVNQDVAWRIREMAFSEGRDLADPFEVFGGRPDPFGTLYSNGTDSVGHPNPDGFDLLAQIFYDVLRGIDSVPPVPGALEPPDGAVDVSPRATIRLRLYDFGAGTDLGATDLLVDGRAVSTSLQGDERRVDLRFTPVEPLQGVVEVGYRTRDLAPAVNQRERTLGSFVVQGTEFLDGDLNRDGRVDGVDLVRLALAFGSRRGERRYDPAADLDDDGRIDGSDLAILAANFGRSSG